MGLMAACPERIVRAVDDQPLERELRGPPRRVSLRRRSAGDVASSACAWTTSSGANAPTSTRARLSSTSLVASASERSATSDASIAYTKSQYAFRTLDSVRDDRAAQRDFRHLLVQLRDLKLRRVPSMRNPRRIG